MRDLVSYNNKHNDANDEHNRDGTDDNRSWNCGVEGDTDDPAVNELRARQVRNLLATLLLSTGVPMLVAGDEMGRSQGGNNNAYCQDNETSYLDWDLAEKESGLLELSRLLIDLRRTHPVFRQRAFFLGRPVGEGGVKDLAWFTPNGEEMSVSDWLAPAARTIGMYLSGQGIRTRDSRGGTITDDSFLLLLHAAGDPVDFVLPGLPWASSYELILDTGQPLAEEPLEPATHLSGDKIARLPRSFAVLRAYP
jgi:glycogen operon protein